MKSIISILTVAAILAIAPPAMAQAVKVKVPKLLCVDMDMYPDKHQLVLKSTGSIYDPSGNVKTHTITGRDFYGPISGSGYVVPNTTIFYATYSGSHLLLPDGTIPQFATYVLQIDLTAVDKAGTFFNSFEVPGGQSFTNCSQADIIDCNTLEASYEDQRIGTASLDTESAIERECPVLLN